MSVTIHNINIDNIIAAYNSIHTIYTCIMKDILTLNKETYSDGTIQP